MINGCIIVPCFNEEGNIARVINEASETNTDMEIVVINDASTDQTSRAARSTKKATVLDLPANLGVGGAVQTGLKYAVSSGAAFAVKLDGDGQHPADAVSLLLRPLKDNQADIVVGSRFLEANTGFRSSFARRLGIKFFGFLCLLLTGRKFTDPTSGFRAYNKKAINYMAKNYPTFDYPEPEELVLASKDGLRIIEIPVKMRERLSGVSTISSSISIYYMLKVTLAMVFIYLRAAEKPIENEETKCSQE